MKKCRKLEEIMVELESSFPNAEIVREKSKINIQLGKFTSILVTIREWDLFDVTVVLGKFQWHNKVFKVQAIKDFLMSINRSLKI